MTIPAYPLQWPHGWKRTSGLQRTEARFGKASRSRPGGWEHGRALTIAEGLQRVLEQLDRMGLSRDDIVVNSDLLLRLDGFPKSGQREPEDPGVCVYWRESGDTPRCMAIDRYDRVADNLAAIAATLDAMRAIERHGGAEILDRAFTGFVALPPADDWREVLGCPAGPNVSFTEVEGYYRIARSKAHPDRHGGTADQFDRVQRAWERAQQEIGATS